MFDEETLAKLTTALAGDTDLYNKVINLAQEKEHAIQQAKQENDEVRNKLTEAEQRNQQYLGQISNLLSKIPIGNTQTQQSTEQILEEIKNRSW